MVAQQKEEWFSRIADSGRLIFQMKITSLFSWKADIGGVGGSSSH